MAYMIFDSFGNILYTYTEYIHTFEMKSNMFYKKTYHRLAN